LARPVKGVNNGNEFKEIDLVRLEVEVVVEGREKTIHETLGNYVKDFNNF